MKLKSFDQVKLKHSNERILTEKPEINFLCKLVKQRKFPDQAYQISKL